MRACRIGFETIIRVCSTKLKKSMSQTILFVGGGTMGPVTPLVAVARAMKIRQPDLVMAWAGTPDGPERQVVEANGFVFYPIPVAKLPTYLSVRWLTWPFDYLRALFAARRVVKNVQPNLVASWCSARRLRTA
jgi:UDP-N-acetylglucosamine--N-acetylmuramyl-(pentapeptide) pyrophosphoryl-undecaprenol N-acetylglucosamine transferase